MAGSSDEGKGFFADWIKHFATFYKFVKFLDVGPGRGVYGTIIRQTMTPEWLAAYTQKDEKGEWNWWGAVPEIVIDAVEAYAEYVELFDLPKIYNDIILRDIRHIYNDIGSYDVIIMGDVIEHLTKEEAVEVVTALKSKCCFLWAALPMVMEGKEWSIGYNQLQPERDETPWSAHLHEWTVAELREAFNPLWITPYRFTGTMLIEGELPIQACEWIRQDFARQERQRQAHIDLYGIKEGK